MISTQAIFLLGMIALTFSIGVWFVLVRPVAEQSATGTITSRAFLPAETVRKVIPRTDRSLEDLPREIKYALPDRYLFSIRLDGRNADARFSAIAAATENIHIGQQVRLTYYERYIPFVWTRIYVKEMAPLTDPRQRPGQK